jgi:hypothetical protein
VLVGDVIQTAKAQEDVITVGATNAINDGMQPAIFADAGEAEAMAVDEDLKSSHIASPLRVCSADESISRCSYECHAFAAIPDFKFSLQIIAAAAKAWRSASILLNILRHHRRRLSRQKNAAIFFIFLRISSSAFFHYDSSPPVIKPRHVAVFPIP